MSFLRLLPLLCLTSGLSACGMKGDLYLSDGTETAEVAPVPSPAVPAPGTTEAPSQTRDPAAPVSGEPPAASTDSPSTPAP